MEQGIAKSILPFKIQQLIDTIIDKKNVAWMMLSAIYTHQIYTNS